jgi:hypothetical protein
MSLNEFHDLKNVKITTKFEIHKMWLKLANIDSFSAIFTFVQVVEHIRDSFRTNTVKNEAFSNKSKTSIFANFSYILWTKNPVLKKVGKASSGNLFSIWCFLYVYALGYPKWVTFFVRDRASWLNDYIAVFWRIFLFIFFQAHDEL